MISLKRLRSGALVLAALLVPVLSGAPFQGDTSSSPANVISFEAAAQNLINRVEPVYPPLAKATRIQGTVKFRVVITPEGKVTDISLISGHPLLVTSARQAIKEWRFKPFLQDGQPVSVRAELDVPFSLGIPAAASEQEERKSQEFFKKDKLCRTEYQAHQLTEAEQSCEAEVKLADELPAERRMERVGAHDLYGQVMIAERKYPEALKEFQHELSIAEGFMHSYDAELAYAHYHLAVALHLTAQPTEALAEYKKAEETLTEARSHIGSDVLKQRYSETLKRILQAHATLLKQSGDTGGAAALENQAAALN
jgi:TonB family protein